MRRRGWMVVGAIASLWVAIVGAILLLRDLGLIR